MDQKKELIWANYFGMVAAIRFHPRNWPSRFGEELNAHHLVQTQNIEQARRIADEMLEKHLERWPCQS